MGFLGRIFGGKKHRSAAPKDRRRWGFTRSSVHTAAAAAPPAAASVDGLDADKHAIAVAAATAVVAEAALAAAHAAAEVVRLTRGPGGGGGSVASGHRLWAKEYLAVVKIQSAFRGYLARRALRALKALVKLQALVRGHIVRKQTADMLRRMQTLVRLQARARASRSHMSESFHSISKSSHSQHGRCVSNSNLREIIDLESSRMGSNRLEHWMEESLWHNRRDISSRHVQFDDDKADKILEVDTWKPHLVAHQSSRTFRACNHSLPLDSNNHHGLISSFESPRKLSPRAPNPIPSDGLSLKNDPAFSRSADNSPQVHSSSSRPGSSSRRSPFTPTRSEYSGGYFGNYGGYCPNYMANTESYRAKVRSQSAPRQRLEFERSGNRSVQEFSYYYAESSFDQRSESRNGVYRDASDRLNRISSPNLR